MPPDCRRSQLCSCYDLARFGSCQRCSLALRARLSSTIELMHSEKRCQASWPSKTRLFKVHWSAESLNMRGLMDTPRRHCHHGNLPNDLRAAAGAILDEAGPDVVGLRETARRVGVSATAAHRHFANSKEDLLASVAAEGFRELAAAMETGATGSDPLGRVGLAYFDFALQKRDLFRLMFGPILVERRNTRS